MISTLNLLKALIKSFSSNLKVYASTLLTDGSMIARSAIFIFLNSISTGNFSGKGLAFKFFERTFLIASSYFKKTSSG